MNVLEKILKEIKDIKSKAPESGIVTIQQDTFAGCL